MKLSILLFRMLPFIVAGLIIGGVMSCRSAAKADHDDAGIAEINDSLRRGNLKDAIRLTDRLKEEALSRGDSETWSAAMVQQGVNAYYQGKPGLVLASADSALIWLERQEHTPERARVLAKAYQTRGAYYDQFSFNPDSTAKYLRLSVVNVELSGIRADLPQAYANYANALRMGAALDSAALYYHRAITVADSLNLEPVHYIPLYNGIASVLTDMRDFDNSAIWWEKSMSILGEMNQFDKFNTLTGYGNDFYYREDYAGANNVFGRLRSMLDSVPESKWERMFTDVNLADTYIRLGRTREASDILDSTARYFSVVQPNPVVRSYIHTLQMRAALKTNDFEWANYLAKMYPASDSLRLEQLLARLQVLEELYSRTGNYKLAYEMQRRYDHLNDSLRSYKLKQQISTLNAMYQRDKRILNLEAGNTRQQARIFRLLAVVALSLVVIVGLILWIVLRRGRVLRREERMMRKIVTLRQENLRNRVTPHFIYNALNHELNNVGNGKPSHLDSLVHLIRRQQYIASEILIPFADELAFVDDYIRIIGDNGRDSLNYNYNIASGLTPDFLFPSMALQILVENAFKHGFSTLAPGEERILNISVTRFDKERISVTVFNNSGTVAAAVKSGGTGLRVLVETIRLINERNREKTEFTINTASECEGRTGCVAIITIPLSLKQ